VTRTSVVSFGHNPASGVLSAPWLPKRIIDFDGNEHPITPSLRWEDQCERLRNLIAISRNLRAMWGIRRPRRNLIDEQNRRLGSRIAINRKLRAMYGLRSARHTDEQNRRLRNWIAINRLCRAMFRPKRFASDIRVRRELLRVANS
jgi:hypothetical protein